MIRPKQRSSYRVLTRKIEAEFGPGSQVSKRINSDGLQDQHPHAVDSLAYSTAWDLETLEKRGGNSVQTATNSSVCRRRCNKVARNVAEASSWRGG